MAATQMHGTEVTFFDPRLSDPKQYPVAARSGFLDKAQCATCHVPPLYTERGYAIHKPADIGISFQADRSPTHGYRTAPLAGLWTHQKGGFYHDGRFATLEDVVNHYDAFFGLGLTHKEKLDLVQFLLSCARRSAGRNLKGG